MHEKPEERPTPDIDTVRKELGDRDEEIENAELDDEEEDEEQQG